MRDNQLSAQRNATQWKQKINKDTSRHRTTWIKYMGIGLVSGFFRLYTSDRGAGAMDTRIES